MAFGTYGYGVSSFRLRNDLLLDLPELSYIAINVRGCRAYVQVRERVEAPEIISKRQPGNTVAAKDALVTEIQPWDGEKMVLPGTTVTAGPAPYLRGGGGRLRRGPVPSGAWGWSMAGPGTPSSAGCL